MAKGYWIARVDVKNEERYKPYAAANPAIFKKYGGRFLVRGGKFDAAEGSTRARNVVIEFPDYAAALACYRSPEYKKTSKSGCLTPQSPTIKTNHAHKNPTTTIFKCVLQSALYSE